MLNSIQILRALAAWLVVGHHIIQLYYKSSTSGIVSEILHKYGAIGVDLFFIISGFVIYASASKKSTSPADFAKNRLIRIVPAYWAFTLITAAILIYAPNSIPLTSLEPIFLLKSLFFIPAQNPSGIGLYPLMTVGWTLNYEMSFYAVFFISLFLPQKMRIASLFVGVALIQFAASKAGEPFSFYKNAIVWEFLLGVSMQIAYQRGLFSYISPAIAVAAVLLAVGTIAHAGPVSHDLYKSGLPCAIILCAAVSQERFFPKHNFIVKLGDWSYSTYLSHILVICLAIHISEQFQVNDYALMFCICVLTLAISIASFSLIEKPLCVALKKYQISRATIREAV